MKIFGFKTFACSVILTGSLFAGTAPSSNFESINPLLTFVPYKAASAKKHSSSHHRHSSDRHWGCSDHHHSSHSSHCCRGPTGPRGATGPAGSGTADNFVFSYALGDATITDNTVLFGPNAHIDGWTHVPGSSDFVCHQAGLYLVIYRLQLNLIPDEPAYSSAWAELNDVEIVGSQIAVASESLPLGDNWTLPATTSFLVSCTALDVLTIKTDSTVLLSYGSATPTNSSITITRIQ